MAKSLRKCLLKVVLALGESFQAEACRQAGRSPLSHVIIGHANAALYFQMEIGAMTLSQRADPTHSHEGPKERASQT